MHPCMHTFEKITRKKRVIYKKSRASSQAWDVPARQEEAQASLAKSTGMILKSNLLIQIYSVYIYIYVCVCVSVSVYI